MHACIVRAVNLIVTRSLHNFMVLWGKLCQMFENNGTFHSKAMPLMSQGGRDFGVYFIDIEGSEIWNWFWEIECARKGEVEIFSF